MNEVYRKYINEFYSECSTSADIDKSQLEEIKGHLIEYIQDQLNQGLTTEEVRKNVMKEFGSPSHLAEQLSFENEKIETRIFSNKNMDIIIAVFAIVLVYSSSIKYTPIGLLFIYIAVKSIITKNPFAFAYYKKKPRKIYNKGPFWFYNAVFGVLGVLLIILEWV